MASVTDKARFYLEKSVPELKEYERKKIFSKVNRAHSSITNLFADNQLSFV